MMVSEDWRVCDVDCMGEVVGVVCGKFPEEVAVGSDGARSITVFFYVKLISPLFCYKCNVIMLL